MKKTKQLKTITDIIFYVYAVGVIIFPIAAIIILIYLFTTGIIYEEKKYTSITFLTILWGIIQYGVSIGLLYCLSLFRKIIDLFLQLQIFHPDVISLFNRIGKYLIILGFIILLINFCIPLGYTFITTSEIGFSSTKIVKYNFEFLNVKWLLIAGTGLFFQVLSEILKKAQNLKQENDLTI